MKSVKILIVFVFIALFAVPVFSKENMISVNVGANFKLNLKSNPTTGYQWQLAAPLDKSVLELVSSEYIAPNTNLTGADGKEIWIFKAVKSGKTKISFKYVRPWENVAPVAQKFYIIKAK